MIGDGCQEKPPETSQDCGLGKSSDEAKWGRGLMEQNFIMTLYT